MTVIGRIMDDYKVALLIKNKRFFKEDGLTRSFEGVVYRVLYTSGNIHSTQRSL